MLCEVYNLIGLNIQINRILNSIPLTTRREKIKAETMLILNTNFSDKERNKVFGMHWKSIKGNWSVNRIFYELTNEQINFIEFHLLLNWE